MASREDYSVRGEGFYFVEADKIGVNLGVNACFPYSPRD
jgi:hypothetical protein